MKDDHFDQCLNAAVILPSGDELYTGKTTMFKKSKHGKPTGVAHVNSMINIREYMLDLPNGIELEFSTNKIAEAMITQCDPQGKQYLLLDCIVDIKMDQHTVQMVDTDIVTKGRKYLRKTTKGWHLCVI